MTTKNFVSPLSSIFQQWNGQQKGKDSPSPSSSYRMLLQISSSLQDRIAVAEPVENAHVYHRAGLPTPAERSAKDIIGGGDSAWLLRLLELSAVSAKSDERIVYVKVKSPPNNYCLVQDLPSELHNRVDVVDVSSRNPWGWDDENDDFDGDDGAVNMSNLPKLFRRLKKEIEAAKCTKLIWQSLMPLIMVHGFPKVFTMVYSLPPCFQVWPVHVQGLTPRQHALMEDAVNCLMVVQGGEMNMIREGIRERGNILRENLPFQLVTDINILDDGEQHPIVRYRVVEDLSEEKGRKNGKEEEKFLAVGSSATEANKMNLSEPADNTLQTLQGSRPRVQLRLEEEDHRKSRANINSNQPICKEEGTGASRPRIFLQDDDPEFNDLDEEDPDDDLDV
jgi:hypothetical protein